MALWTFLRQEATAKSPPSGARCLECGGCCESFGGHLKASARDLDRWRKAGRSDLLARVNRLGWLWVDPVTKRAQAPCPFIVRIDRERARCAIYEQRPDICRDYPTLAHGKRCLRGVFLSWWLAVCCEALPEWNGLLGELALAV